MRKHSSKFIVFLVVISSCVTPYDVSTQFHKAIVVQGMVTDQPGPYLIQVSKTVPINVQGEDAGVLTGATVILKDDQGNSETLNETSPGNFYTNNIQGVVGNTYTLTVTTSEGYIYQSSPEKISPVGDITNLRYEFVANEPADYGSQEIVSSNGFDIYLDCDVLPEQEGRIWWRWTGTYHIFTFPKLHTKLDFNGKVFLTEPDPLACSGFSVFRGELFWTGSPCTCCDCWVTEYNQNPLISDPRIISNGKLSDFYVAFVQANRRTMYDKYILQLEKLSISENVYGFWHTVNLQRSNSSNLFQTPPPKTNSNLFAQTPNALPVIGYFAACAVKRQVIQLDQSDVPYKILPIDTIQNSCANVYENSTNQKPTFW